MSVSRIRGELRYLVRELGLLDKNCLESGLTLGQAHILTYLERNGATPFSELRCGLNVDKASLSRTLGTLQARGLLETARDADDGRQRVVGILPGGVEALAAANTAADAKMGRVLDGLDGGEMDAVWRGLRLLRRAAARKNMAVGGRDVQVERLDPAYADEVAALVEEVFAGEQGIGAELIPVRGDEVLWWSARSGEYIVGAVACWLEGGAWHWGRFAVDGQYRGLGLGRRLARRSLRDFFSTVSDSLVIDARDSAAHILRGFGARAAGPTGDFYGMPITPMTLCARDFRDG